MILFQNGCSFATAMHIMKLHSFLLTFGVLLMVSCQSTEHNKSDKAKPISYKYALHIPTQGIESMMEANSQKIIEGNAESLIVQIGQVTRKEADITLRANDKIVHEKMMKEKDQIEFIYRDHPYTLQVLSIKKPLVGSGKVKFTIH